MSRPPQKDVLFLLVLEEPPPSSTFSLKNLPGMSKIDVVSRLVLSLFPSFTTWSCPWLQVIFTKEQPHLLEVKALPERDMPFDEVEVAALIRATIKAEKLPTGCDFSWRELSSFEQHLQTLTKQGFQLSHLTETGSPLETFLPLLQDKSRFCFLLGGRYDLSEEHTTQLASFGAKKLTLGGKSYLASTCTTYLVYALEKLFHQTIAHP